jgi:hypothetical protein
VTAATLHATAAYGVVGSVAELPTVPLDDAGWRPLLSTARQERALGLLAAAARAGALPLTECQQVDLARFERDGQCVAILLERLLAGLGQQLGELGVDSRVLKGAATAHLDYPGASLRLIEEASLLIRPEHLHDAVSALTTQGWRRQAPEPARGYDKRFGKGITLVDVTGLRITLQRTLAPPPFGLGINIDELWDRPEWFELAGTRLAALSPEARLAHACLETATQTPSLVQMRDIVQLVGGGRVDPQRFLEMVSAWRLGAVAAFAIQQSWTTLSVHEVPRLSAWAARYEPTRWEDKSLARVCTPGVGYAARALPGVRLIRGPIAKLAYVRAIAFPDRVHTTHRRLSRVANVRGLMVRHTPPA